MVTYTVNNPDRLELIEQLVAAGMDRHKAEILVLSTYPVGK